ncbi:MAG: 4'-phosphopantetheinyl transferase superfamily protein, partial [Cyanobacteria bacterium P01_A01_bin.135]
CIRPVSAWERLARRYFSCQERDYLQGLCDAARQRAFLQIWTQKEAYVKATGEGIRGLAAGCPNGWRYATTEIPGAVMSVAASGELQAVRRFIWA